MKSSSVFLLAFLFLSCAQSGEPRLVTNVGNAQGSTYQIKYLVTDNRNFADEIVKIFEDIDQSMSTYKPESIISQVNKGDTLVAIDAYFDAVLTRSLEIAEESEGAFDPTIGPLVSLWGFGLEKRGEITDEHVQEVKQKIGYSSIIRENGQVKIPAGFTIDFNAIAQGYTVDVLGE